MNVEHIYIYVYTVYYNSSVVRIGAFVCLSELSLDACVVALGGFI